MSEVKRYYAGEIGGMYGPEGWYVKVEDYEALKKLYEDSQRSQFPDLTAAIKGLQAENKTLRDQLEAMSDYEALDKHNAILRLNYGFLEAENAELKDRLTRLEADFNAICARLQQREGDNG